MIFNFNSFPLLLTYIGNNRKYISNSNSIKEKKNARTVSCASSITIKRDDGMTNQPVL